MEWAPSCGNSSVRSRADADESAQTAKCAYCGADGADISSKELFPPFKEEFTCTWTCMYEFLTKRSQLATSPHMHKEVHRMVTERAKGRVIPD